MSQHASVETMTTPGRPGLWETVRLALAGKELDYTQGPITRAVVLLAIPMVLEMAMESVFAITDALFVSRLGVDAIAAVGLTEAVVTLIYAVAGGVSMAATSMVARRIGEKDTRTAALTAVQATGTGLVVSLFIAVPGALFAEGVLHAMGGSPSLVAGGAGYTRVMLGGSSTIMLIFLINATLRGAGDAAYAMRALWLANGINIVLDPCLIFGLGPFPELGLTGAAVATTVGRGIGVIYQLSVLFRGRVRIRFDREVLRLRLDIVRRLLQVSLGGVLQYLIATASWVALVWIVSSFGSAAVAGYTIAIRIIIFALLPSWGIANAAATLMGQNLGAGQPDRAETSVWRAGLFNMVFLGAVALFTIAGAKTLVGVFSAEEAVLASGVACLRLICCGYGFYAWGMVVTQAFNGAGDTYTPTLINLFCYWFLQIPLAYALARATSLGLNGVYLAVTIAESVLAVVAVLVFRRGRWRSKQV